MKKTAILLIAAALSGLQLEAQTFDGLYSGTEKFKKIGSQVTGGAVSPVWKDAGTLRYSVSEKDGTGYYEIDVTSGAKTAVAKDSLDVLSARRPGPEGGFYPRREESAGRKSPDGKLIAFIKDSNLWVAEASSPEDASQLSFDGTEQNAYTRIMWSPDSHKIAALKEEVVKERQILLRESRPSDQVQPKYRWLDYAKPGDVLPQSVPALFDAESKSQIPVDASPFSNQFTLNLGQWSPDSDWFTFEYNQRGHQLYQLVAVDAASGKTRILAREDSGAFVYYDALYRYYFKDGKHILWASERDDWRHLYMIDTHDGSMRQITKGEWNVREILNVDEKAGTVLMYANGMTAASGEDPYNKHVLLVDLNSGSWKDLTPENAFHTATFNQDFSCFVDVYSRPDLAPASVLRSGSDGSVLMKLSEADISGVFKTGYTMPEVFSAKGRDGVTDIWGTIYRPSNFNPRKKYPVVEYIYAGPHDSHVTKTFSAYMRFTRLLEMGFIVVTIDGMGTDNRSKSFQDVSWRNLKDGGFPDRILWIKAAAAKYKYMDLSKMGIYGYSAGGQNTLSALLFYPEFYKVGVALCGCHDNRMDKIWWNEQFMGWPVGPWYSENSNVDNAWRLEGKLLIINGEVDDNVDPASSLQVVAELVRNNKDFEQLYLPGYSHNLGDDYVTRRIFEFFWRNCR